MQNNTYKHICINNNCLHFTKDSRGIIDDLMNSTKELNPSIFFKY